MKEKSKEPKSKVFPESRGEPAVLRDAAVAGGDRAVTVRDAKAHLSALLEWVAGGRAVTITSDGRPKGRLVPVAASRRKAFGGAEAHLARMPDTGGRPGEELIREDRDGRGW